MRLAGVQTAVSTEVRTDKKGVQEDEIMRIYVGGSLKHVPDDPNLCSAFVAKLGKEMVKQGHVLLNGCRSELDRAIAKAAADWLVANKRPDSDAGDPANQIISYVLKSEKPIHSHGVVRRSTLTSWKLDQPDPRVPEQIDRADAAIFIAGGHGTFLARNWAYYARKPIFGIPRFGGSGELIYEQELHRLQDSASVLTEEYENLNQWSTDMGDYARTVIAAVEGMVRPRKVFVIMSFEKTYDDAYRVFKEVCKQSDFFAERTSESSSSERITQLIETNIRQSAFVIADVSKLSPNVFYELGFARALGKETILTARQNTPLPFDVHDLQTIFWNTPKDLETGLQRRVSDMQVRHGVTSIAPPISTSNSPTQDKIGSG